MDCLQVAFSLRFIDKLITQRFSVNIVTDWVPNPFLVFLVAFFIPPFDPVEPKKNAAFNAETKTQ